MPPRDGNIATLVKTLKRQQILDMAPGNAIIIESTLYYETCPHFTKEKQSIGSAVLSGVRLNYYNEMFTRILSYFLNRLLWAITDADPYPKKPVEMSDDLK